MSSFMNPGVPPVNREVLHDMASEREAELARHAERIRAQHGEEKPRRRLFARLRSAFHR